MGRGRRWAGSRTYRTIRIDPEIIAAGGGIPGLDELIDFALCLETLEQAAQPRALLRSIGRHLTPGGHLFVSVPDAEAMHQPLRVGGTPQITGCRHYFSAESLAALAVTAGLRRVVVHNVVDPMTPRLAGVFRKTQAHSVADAIDYATSNLEHQYGWVAQRIAQLAEQHERLSFWGGGTDLAALLDRSPQLRMAIAAGSGIRIFDRQLKGRFLGGCQIEDPQMLTEAALDGPVILTALRRAVRENMLAFARIRGFLGVLIDPMADVPAFSVYSPTDSADVYDWKI